MVKGVYKIALIISLLGCTIMVHSQVLLPDTIDLESVSVYYKRGTFGTRAGVKSVTIDSLVISEKTGLSLSELLQENSPIFIKTYGRGATATASFRGTGASHTNVYWNGIKINSPMSGEADFSLIPLYFIDDVAIHFGQSSMSYGSGGLGGSVNMQSTPDWTKPFGIKVYQSVGSFDTYSTAAKSTYGKGNLKAQTRVFRELSQNNFNYRNTAKINRPIEIQQNADYLKYGILQEIYYRPNGKNMISAKVWAQETSRGIPQLMSNFSSLDKNRQNDRTLNTVLDWRNSGEKISWKFSSGLSHISLNYDFSKISLEGNELPILEANSRSWSWYNKATVKRDLTTWLIAEIQTEINSHWVNSQEQILQTGYTGRQLHSAVRTTLNASPTERLSISILLGEDFYDEEITPLSSSVTLEYKILKKNNLIAKGGVSRNYHHPSLNDLYWKPGGNENLKSEDGITWEGGFNYSINQGNVNASFDLSYFSSRISNWIMWLPHLKGYWEPINLNLVKASGIEVSVSTNYLIGSTKIKFLGTYGYTSSTIVDAGEVMRPEAYGKQLPFIPIHSGGIAVNALWRKYHLVYSFTHYSERYTTTSNNPNSIRRLYPYYMSSAALGKDFRIAQTKIGMQLRVDNLLNESYQTILWRPMPGRNFSLVVRFEL
jgi:iron complex outermembrane receptor protein